VLRQRFAGRGDFEIIEGDALASKHSLNPELLAHVYQAADAGATMRLVANLPYNIASPLVIEMLIAGVEVLAFTVQKEVADRLRALPATEDYGPLTVMAQLLAKVELLRPIPPQAFWPSPRIDSSLVRLVRQDQLGKRAAPFGTFVHQLFSSRRKTLRRGLTQAGYAADAMLAAAALDGIRRCEEFTPAQLLCLFQQGQAGS